MQCRGQVERLVGFERGVQAGQQIEENEVRTWYECLWICFGGYSDKFGTGSILIGDE